MKKFRYKIILFLIIAIISTISMTIIINSLGILIFGPKIATDRFWLFITKYASAFFGVISAEIFVGLLRFILNKEYKKDNET